MVGHALPAEHDAQDDAGRGKTSSTEHLQRIRQPHLHRPDLRRHPTAQQGRQQLRSVRAGLAQYRAAAEAGVRRGGLAQGRHAPRKAAASRRLHARFLRASG